MSCGSAVPNERIRQTRLGCRDLLARAIDLLGPDWDTVLAAAARGLATALATARRLDPAQARAGLPIDAPDVAWPASQPLPADPEALGWLHESWLAARARDTWSRKGTGAFYTPTALIEPLIERALTDQPAPLNTDPATLCICDPACGGGAFLLGALRHLCRTHPTIAVGDWVPTLHGVDLDPHAVQLTRTALWLEAGDDQLDPAVFTERIRHGDALLGAGLDDLRAWPERAFQRSAGDTGHTGPHLQADLRDDRLRRFRERCAAAPPEWTPSPDAADRDLWTAAWLWPAESLDELPFPLRSPVSAEARALASSLARRHAFLHWDLTFPEVFAPHRRGFDLILGNPPWDSARLEARSFFREARGARGLANDPLGARERHALCAASPDLESAWLDHRELHAARTNRVRHLLRSTGRAAPNLGLAFVARSLDLLRSGGRLAMLVPSALHSDLGARSLRQRLFAEDGLRVLVGFENRRGLFEGIDARFKFDAVIAVRDRPPSRIATEFMATTADALRSEGFELDVAQVRAASPRSLSIPEYRDAAERATSERALGAGLRLGDDDARAFRPSFHRELDLSLDAGLFHDRPDLEALGYQRDLLDRWVLIHPGAPYRLAEHARDDARLLPLADGRAVPLDAVEDLALPILEGRMLGPLRIAAKAWSSGRGRRAIWHERSETEPPRLEPRVLIRATDLRRKCPDTSGPKVGFMAIGSATNAYTMVAAAVPSIPCGNSVPCLRAPHDPLGLGLLAVLGSLPFDALLRPRLAGLNLNRFTLDEAITPQADHALLATPALRLHVARLAWRHPLHAADWLALRAELPPRLRALAGPRPESRTERNRQLAALDAVIASTLDLTPDDMAWICRDCDREAEALRRPATSRDLDPKGLWRIDRDLPADQRRTSLAVAASQQLTRLLDRTDDVGTTLEQFLLEPRSAARCPDHVPYLDHVRRRLDDHLATREAPADRR